MSDSVTDHPATTSVPRLNRVERRTREAAEGRGEPINPDALYSVYEICRHGRIGRTSAYRAMNSDPAYRRGLPHLKSVRVGGARRIRGQWYLDWLDALERQAEVETGEGEVA